MRRLIAPVLTVLATVSASTVASAPPAGAATPAGFTDQLVAALGSPTAMDFTPDGRLLAATQGGLLRVIQNGSLLATPAVDLTAKICTNSERGLLGVAVDPSFTTNGYVFLYYTFKKGASCDSTAVNRVSRFVMSGNALSGESVLIDNIPSPAGNHNAGDLNFGKDNLLYVSVGDGGCDYANTSQCAASNTAARRLYTLVGKILRIDRDGNIPSGNPHQGTGTARCNTTGVDPSQLTCREIFATGLRNPFRMAFDPNSSTTAFHINDVGQSSWEEIDRGVAGADYGWNVREGHCATGSTTNCGPPPVGMTNPIFDYGRSDGCTTITGGAFVPNGAWPAAFDGKYLFADYGCGKIFRLDPNGAGGYTRVDFVTGLGGGSAVDLTFGPWKGSQALYYTTYAGGGQIRRIASTAGTTDDFAGDGLADIAVFRPSNGAWYVRNGLTVAFGTNGDVPVSGDYDGDGTADVAVYRPSTGTWFVRLSSGGQTALTFGGINGDIPVPADYDGDRRTDIAIFRPAVGGWYVHRSTGGDSFFTFGTDGDIPVPADYDGDGRADMSVFRPSGGVWHIHPSSGSPDAALGYGASTDVPVPADYDGDGSVDIAVYRPSTGTWFARRSGTGTDMLVTYGGISSDTPVPATYDGDAKADLTIVRRSSQTWFTRGSVLGTDTAVTWGINGDVPVNVPPPIRMAYFA